RRMTSSAATTCRRPRSRLLSAWSGRGSADSGAPYEHRRHALECFNGRRSLWTHECNHDWKDLIRMSGASAVLKPGVPATVAPGGYISFEIETGQRLRLSQPEGDQLAPSIPFNP